MTAQTIQANDLQLLSRKQVAELIKVNPSTIWRWVRQGEFPRPIRIGRESVRWRSADIRTWIEAKSG